VRSPLIIGRREKAGFWVNWIIIETNWGFGFWGERIQRRGTHVNILEIGSRGALLCFGGILGIYADLRREFNLGNLSLGVLGNLGGVPRGSTEEGGQFVLLLCLGESYV
jgi:hypothetical protein